MTSRPGALADCRGQAALRERRLLSSQGHCFWLSAWSSSPGPGLSARRPAPGGGDGAGKGMCRPQPGAPGAAQEHSGSPPAAFVTLFVFFSPKKNRGSG